ncbi:hypothetical protein H9X96_14940 [Pedobacter sp. N36a]|uniref:hypothetical protein n=1 Tax=Pedobacter sp. N36a TaxID=2767996 RepID=UPI001657271C|nr:hypothetical protein [Pedobacter sp. N36a]MBC8987067.1 hypothetical protein [Pedobacter sp. N36a]
MKPNEHMKLPDDELIAHIKEQLMAHEEDYAPGAWENFNSEKPAKKRGVFFWFGSLSSAAALILIGFAIFLINERKEGPKPSVLTGNKTSNQDIKLTEKGFDERLKSGEFAKEKEKIGLSNPRASKQNVSASVPQNLPLKDMDASEGNDVGQGKGINEDKGLKKENAAVASTKIPMDQQPLNTAVAGLNNSSMALVKDKTTEAALPKAPIVVQKQSLEEFLAQESKNGNARGRRNTGNQRALAMQDDKWEMGVMVAPSFGSSKKLNMGYGVSMAYALSKKVSINSGISYNEMGASRNAASSAGAEQNMPSTFAGGFPSNSKQLQSVDASLQGIDIPLEISYRLSKSLYANVGISAFAVLNQKRKNIFLESQVQDSPVDPAGTFAFKSNVLNTMITEERQSSDELKTDPYLGFYNFSLGYKQRISRGKSVSLEPFLKLPIKEFTQENLYLIGTGLRVKFDF